MQGAVKQSVRGTFSQSFRRGRGLMKLSNTFPVDVKQNELPSEEMYMAGKSLFPLTIEMARRVSR